MTADPAEPPPGPPPPDDYDVADEVDQLNAAWENDQAASAPRTWRPVDLNTVLAGSWEPPRPTVGSRRDGVGLFYPGKTHTVSAETEAGKSWLALAAVTDELIAGRHVAYLDFEDDEGGVGSRLLALQVQPDRISSHFHYIRPMEPLGRGINLDDLLATFISHTPGLTIIDGVTEAMTLNGLDPLSNTDIATFGRMLPRRATAAGSATVCLDHVVKDRENRGRYAMGGAHKLNGLDGAAYLLETRAPFGIGVTGKSTIKIAKDRPGQLRRHALTSAGGMHWFGDLVLTSHAEDFAEIEIEPPHERDETFRPTVRMQQVARALDHYGPLSQRRVATAVGGNRQSAIDALNYLILDGHVSESSPHELVKPYPPGELTL